MIAKTSRRSPGGGTRKGTKTYAALAELSRSLFDDALVTCDDEREAAFVASARLMNLMERKRKTVDRSSTG